MLFQKDKPKIYRQTQDRVGKLSKPEILDWADQAGSWTARQLGEYRRSQSLEALQEAADGAQILSAIIDTLRAREET